MDKTIGSKEVARAAIMMSLAEDRAEEKEIAAREAEKGIKCVAADFGGEFISSVTKIIERAILTSKKAGIISDTHAEEGAVAGASREAISQIMTKAIGLNVGGKISVARYKEHISVAVFFGIGLLNLNEMSVGLGHRVI